MPRLVELAARVKAAAQQQGTQGARGAILAQAPSTAASNGAAAAKVTRPLEARVAARAREVAVSPAVDAACVEPRALLAAGTGMDDVAADYPEGVVAADVEELPFRTTPKRDPSDATPPPPESPPTLTADPADLKTFLFPGGAENSHRTLERLLVEMEKTGATDIHLREGEPPILRVDGVLRRVDLIPLTLTHLLTYTHALVGEHAMERMRRRAERAERENADDTGTEPGALPEAFVSYTNRGVSYRCTVATQRGTPMIALRRLPGDPPTLTDLGLPAAVRSIHGMRAGLVLIAGSTGAGKTTTLAALLRDIATRTERNIITIEDPIEFRFPKTGLPSTIAQREVGRDTASFATGTRVALRQDLDVLAIGELLDAVTAQNAMSVAQTGHLVLATVHAGSVAETPKRVVDWFRPEDRDAMASQLASVLKVITCQVLLPKVGGGLVAAHGVVPVNEAVASNISRMEWKSIEESARTAAIDGGGQAMSSAVEKLLLDGKVHARDAASVLTRAEVERLQERLR
ncbi:MAG TPA: ATPase, T2SS/T4P/T4SS family [Gemmatimonadaceae bacterium]|nr:ATPase, T2SS/T4P/T4SS family [Gemmatimonadaceae bacterium]